MATIAKGSHKTKLKIESTLGGGNYLNLPEVMDISGGGMSAVTEDVTSHDSDGAEEHLSVGVLAGGDITFTLNAAEPNTAQDLLYAYQAQHVAPSFQLVFPDQTRKRTFNAIIANIGEEYPVKGILRRNITLRVTGPIVRSA